MNKEDKALEAFDLYTKIVEAKSAETNRVFLMGHFFKEFRDKKLYKDLDSECGSFNEFIATPEIGIKRSTVYSYIRLKEKYMDELEFNIEYLSDIGHKRLQLILPHVDKDPVEWLSRAKTWSYKDLINELRRINKRPQMGKEVVVEKDLSGGYLEYVSGNGCIFHEDRKAERAHFLKTKGAGGLDIHVIPLCHECHQMYHGMGVVSFFGRYRDNIMDYFYGLIKNLYEEINK